MAPRRHDFIVIANRLPVQRVGSGFERRWEVSPGGLVAALQPVLADRGGAWLGWAGEAGPAPEPFRQGGFLLHPVPLSRGELQLYYEGFSNGTLWPLYHDALAVPEYHRTWWDSYSAVNQRFAQSAAALAARNAVVWVHDYQLQLVPKMLRDLRPDLRIGWFNHIPFPARELFMRMPWRTPIIEGLLGADVVGFQTRTTARNFLNTVPRVTYRRVERNAVRVDDRVVQVKVFPIGIDVARIDEIAQSEETKARAAEIRRQLGSPAKVMLGIDRLDYTKGIEVRLRAFRELLDEGRVSAEEITMMQIAEPSRTNVVGYADIRAQVERLVGEINGGFASVGNPAVQYLHQSQPIEEVVAYYRAADVMLVTPFRDGMNLVAKEYVASRVDNSGVLVLSEFAGAAHELRAAMQVNPHDIDGLKVNMEAALDLSKDEARRRMRAMRRVVKRHDAQAWANEFLDTLTS